jgi:hypothetical protein
MKIEDHRPFVEMLAVVFDNYGKELSPALTDFWWQLMQPYDLPALRDAFNRHCVNPDNGQWVPKPADIVKLIEGGTKDSALLEWSKVDRAVRSIGPWESVTFDDPITATVIADMGGWIRLNEGTDDDWPFKAKEFEARYRAYKTAGGVAQAPQKLVGIADAVNRQTGIDDRPVVIAGNGKNRAPPLTKDVALKPPDAPDD